MFDRIMTNGVLGMTAQTKALGNISDNISNATTVGYKSSDTSFQDLVLANRYGSSSGAGVTAVKTLNADKQGHIAETGVGTNAAISGNGFFLVQAMASADKAMTATGEGDVLLTRAGDFSPDATGQFVNSSGRALLALPISPGSTSSLNGRSIDDLEVVNTAAFATYHTGTRNIQVGATLPAEMAVQDAASPLEYHELKASAVSPTLAGSDADGWESRHADITLRFAKTGEEVVTAADGSSQTISTWSVYRAGAVERETGRTLASDVTALGTFRTDAAGLPYGETKGDPVTVPLSLAGYGDMTLNLGQIGGGDGVTVMANTGFINRGSSHDGIPVGTAKDIAITDDGFVRATFGNGQQRDLYRLVNGVVTNSNALEAVSGNAYRVAYGTGDLQIRGFGTRDGKSPQSEDYDALLGTSLRGGSVESSTTDISKEFTTLIRAQRVYSAASKIITTADEMIKTVEQLR